MDDDEFFDEDCDDGWNSEPVDSCDECGVNIYEDDDYGSGLCGQCHWRAFEAMRWESMTQAQRDAAIRDSARE